MYDHVFTSIGNDHARYVQATVHAAGRAREARQLRRDRRSGRSLGLLSRVVHAGRSHAA